MQKMPEIGGLMHCIKRGFSPVGARLTVGFAVSEVALPC